MSYMNRVTTIRRVDGAVSTRVPGEFVTTDQLRQHVPSIFATEAHDSRSARFAPIPTFRLVEALHENGFGVVSAVQSRTRDASRKEFTKHMLRFRRLDAKVGSDRRVGDVFPEVTMVNANDGTSAYHLMAGLFRLICLNGMTVSDNAFEPVRVGHTGNVVDKVIEGTFRVLGDSDMALNRADEWATVQLDRQMQVAFAEAARVVRFGDHEGNVAGNLPITAEQLLAPRRAADRANDLWTITNRIQENAIRGGLSGMREVLNEEGRMVRRRMTTRPIAGIDGDLRVNRGLWMLAEAMGSQFVPAAA